MAGHGADPVQEPMSVTVVLRSPGGAGYGRHAAPPSAYGPADVHRLLPVSPTGPWDPERADHAVPPVEAIDRAVPPGAVAAEDVGTGAPSSGEASTKATGFWARLRLFPPAA
jgi:hypothetical protein